MTTRSFLLLLVLALGTVTSSARADAIEPGPEAPGYQVHVVGMDQFADRAFVNVRTFEPPAHGDPQPGPFASYTLVNDFPVDSPERLCAVPASWVIDSPAGGLGTRMLRGARGASGAAETDPTFVAELLALFSSPEVACGQQFLAPAAGGGAERVVDTIRVAAIDGTTLRVELTEVGYQLPGSGDLISVPVLPGATGRPPVPAARPSSGCGCGIAGPVTDGAYAAVLGLSALALAAARRRRRA